MLKQNFSLERTAVVLIEKAAQAASLVLKMVAVFAIFVSLSGCSPLNVLNALTLQEAGIQTVESLSYGSQQRQKLDIYIPSNATKPAPVVVFFYGGEWRRGSRKDYAFVGETLAARGIVTVIADYRLYPEVRYPEFLVDSSLAAAWVYREIKKYGGDPEQLFLMGHSAGAYNAAMVALDERWLGMVGLTPEIIQGWIGLAGPYNFLPIENPNVQPVFFHPHTPPASQPINHVDPSSPPALLIAAEEDKVVNPVLNTRELAEALRNHGVSVETFYFDEVGHATLVATLSPLLNHLAPTLELVEKFVKSHGRSSLTTSLPHGLTESNSASRK
jgi:acetyl esterase/lipase